MKQPEVQARQIAVSALARQIAEQTPVNAAQVNEWAALCGFSREILRKNLLRAGLRQDNHSLALHGGELPPTLGYWWEHDSTERMSDEQAILLTRKFANGEVRRDINVEEVRQVEEEALAHLQELHDSVEETWGAHDWRAARAKREQIERTIQSFIASTTLPRYGVGS